MSSFIIERTFAEQLDVTPEIAAGVNAINAETGVRWSYSFVSADRKKTYCVYDAPKPEAIREAAQRAGLPADVIMQISGRLEPTGVLTPVWAQRALCPVRQLWIGVFEPSSTCVVDDPRTDKGPLPADIRAA